MTFGISAGAAMLIGGGLGAAATLYSSSKASGAQQAAAQQASETQLKMYNQTRDDQAGYRQAGNNALSALQNGFGFGTNPGTAPVGTTFQLPPEWGGASITTTDQSGKVGGVGFNQFNHQFGADDLKNGLSPNYDFQLQQGMGAVNNQNSVAGGLVGGNALKGISDYAQGSASSAYQNAFNNYNTNQTNIYNRLSSIAGLGQTSNGQTAQAGTALAGNIGSAQLASGAAQAAGYTASGNAISGAGNSISSMYGLNNLTGGSLFGSGQQVGSSSSYAANNFLGE